MQSSYSIELNIFSSTTSGFNLRVAFMIVFAQHLVPVIRGWLLKKRLRLLTGKLRFE